MEVNTIRPTSAEENAVTLDLFSWTNVANVNGPLLDKVRRLLFKVTLSISVNILNELFHSINIYIFLLEGQDNQVAVKSQPVLSDSETFPNVDGDTQPLNMIKKNYKTME